MKRFSIGIVITGILAAALAACGGEQTRTEHEGATGSPSDTSGSMTTEPTSSSSGTATSGTATANDGEVKTYIFHGTVKKIEAATGMITIDHEKIDGYMEAMTMPFKVADPAFLEQVKVGDQTHFTLRVAGDQALITKVQQGHEEGEEH